jgi:hypothetical protein
MRLPFSAVVVALALTAGAAPLPLSSSVAEAHDAPLAWEALLAEARVLAAAPTPLAGLAFHARLDAGAPVLLEALRTPPAALEEEVRAVHALHGAPVDEAGLAGLAALPAPLREALALLLRAHRDAAALTEEAFQTSPPTPFLLSRAKATLVAASLEALPALQPVPGARPYAACGGVLLELAGTSDVHACPYGFAVDLGGDDTWANNAGGNTPGWDDCAPHANALKGAPPTTAFALDAAGDDRYTGRAEDAGVAGGACNGLGALVDAAGHDTYDVTVVRTGGGTGAANYGGGLLLDLAGDDTYRGRVVPSARGEPGSGGLHGGSNFGGHGDLLDLGGRDTYDGSIHKQGGLNGGENDGSGFLLDCGPEGDTYHGTVGFSGGINGASSLGRGALVDCGGDDTYAGTIGTPAQAVCVGPNDCPHGGVNGGAGAESQGLLLDLGGDDTYTGTLHGRGGVNGAAHMGVGLLVDAGGRDTYGGHVHASGGINGGAARGAGALVDLGGDDTYAAWLGGDGGANGGSNLGHGLLLDAGGDDTYDASAPLQRCFPLVQEAGLCGAWANGGGTLLPGLLLDLGGRDAYRTDGGAWSWDASAAKGAGAQVDVPLPVL